MWNVRSRERKKRSAKLFRHPNELNVSKPNVVHAVVCVPKPEKSKAKWCAVVVSTWRLEDIVARARRIISVSADVWRAVVMRGSHIFLSQWLRSDIRIRMSTTISLHVSHSMTIHSHRIQTSSVDREAANSSHWTVITQNRLTFLIRETLLSMRECCMNMHEPRMEMGAKKEWSSPRM